MEIVRLVRIQHTLWLAGGAGGVAETGRDTVVEFAPSDVFVAVGDELRETGRRNARHIRDRCREENNLPHGRTAGQHISQKWREPPISKDHTVACMVDDEAELFVKEARVQSMADCANATDAVPGGEMFRAVHRQGGGN